MQVKQRAEAQAADLERRVDMLESEGMLPEASAQRAAAAVLARHAASAHTAAATLQHTLAEAQHALVVAEAQEGAVREQVQHAPTRPSSVARYPGV